MMEALEALYGFSMWTIKASVVLAVVGAVILTPPVLVSSLWHRFVRGDRRCPQCNAWFGLHAGADEVLSRCSYCRGDVAGSLGQRVEISDSR